ncbi:MAG: tetratricopeptide repeat protein [Kiritimatiellia bacterium]
MTGRRFLQLVSLCIAGVLGATAAFADEAEDRFNFATGLLIKKEYELAVEEFLSLLKSHPDCKQADAAYYRMGDALDKLGREKDAAGAFLKIVTDYPESDKFPRASYRLAQITAADDHSAAAVYYSAVVKKEPEHSLAGSAAFWSGEEYFKAENYTMAAEAYRTVLKDYPDSEYAQHALYSLGWTLYRLERYGPAAKIFSGFLERYPESDLIPDCKVKLAQCLTETEEYSRAQAVFEDVLEAGGEIGHEARTGLAWCLYRRNRLKESAEMFTRAALKLGKSEKAATCLFNAANALMEMENYAEAVRKYESIAENCSGTPLADEADYWRACCLLKLERFREADALLKGIRAEGPLKDKKPEILYTSAEAKFALENYKDAARGYKTVAGKFPDHPLADEAAYGLMLALEKSGKIKAAEAAGRQFFTRFARSETAPSARFALAEYRFRLGAYEESLKDFRAFLKESRDANLAGDAHCKIGWCLMRLDRPAEAFEHFLKSVRDCPGSRSAAEAAYMAGQAAEAAGQTEKAREYYSDCVKKFPSGEYSLRSRLATALLDIDGERYAEGLKKVDSFLKNNPENPLVDYAYVYRGEALAGLKRYSEALEAYAEVKKKRTEAAVDAAYGSAWTLRRMGKHDPAAEAFSDVAGTGSPKAENAAFWYCRCLEDAGKTGRAAGEYGSFLSRYPESERSDEAAYRRALCTSRAEKHEAAREMYRSFLKKKPDSSFAPYAVYDLGWLNMEKGNSEEAEKYFTALVRDYPESGLIPDVSFRLGEIEYEKKHYARAVSCYRKTAGADVPFADKVLYKLGWAYRRLGKQSEAADTFSRLAREFPQSEFRAEARYRAGKALQTLSRYDEAVAEYRKAVSKEFAQRALFGIAECRRLAGKHKEALTAYAELEEKFPDGEFVLQAHLGRGHSYRVLGAFKDAIEAYKSVVKATDTIDAARALMGIGYSHYAQDSWKEAAKAFLKVDILYGYDEVKPEALHMLVKSWQKAGKTEKADKYRSELFKRYPESEHAARVKEEAGRGEAANHANPRE